MVLWEIVMGTVEGIVDGCGETWLRSGVTLLFEADPCRALPWLKAAQSQATRAVHRPQTDAQRSPES